VVSDVGGLGPVLVCSMYVKDIKIKVK